MGKVLNPKIRMQKNKKRILIYIIDDFTYEIQNLNFIHPVYAILFSMFDGKKKYRDILRDFCFLIDKEYNESIVKDIEANLRVIQKKLNINNIFVEGNVGSIKYNPEEFVIPSSEVDLDATDQRIDFPLSINYNVTSSCKVSCRYCYHPRYSIEDYISLERLKFLFNESAKKGCQQIVLSGGDPFDRSDFIKIIELASKEGLNIFTSTKSYLDKKTCHSLKEAGLKNLQISLDAAEPKLAAFLTGMDVGFLNRSIQTIKNLQEVGIKIRLKNVINNHNIDYIEDYLQLCRELNVGHIQLVQYGRSIHSHEDKLFPSEEQMKKANQIIESYRQKYELVIDGGNFGMDIISNKDSFGKNIFTDRIVCHAGRVSFTMIQNGEAFVCEQIPYEKQFIIGDLRTQSISELWNSEKVKKLTKAPDRSYYSDGVPCKTCTDENYKKCHKTYGICYAYSFNYFGNYTSSDLRCTLSNVDNYRIR